MLIYFQSSTNISHTSSSSTNNHQHMHHHTHTHHERLSPGSQLLRHSIHSKPPTPQANPHHLMIQPPNMGHHSSALGKSLVVLNFFFILT